MANKLNCKIKLKSNSLFVDNIMIGMYGVISGRLCLDSSIVLEHVMKQIEYIVDWNIDEITKLLEEEFDEKNWRLFKMRRGFILL